MTSDDAIDIKEVVFLKAAERAFHAVPEEVKDTFDLLLTAIQNNTAVPRNRREDLVGGTLGGISELKVDFDSDTYRTYFVAEFAEVVFVLDAGIKKSKTQGKIPQEQVDVLVERKKQVAAYYKTNKERFERRYQTRQKNRARRAASEAGK